VTRGVDLFEATHLHCLLQHLLHLPTPVYHHHRLIGDADGRKLSKSAGDRSLRSLREAGVTPGEIRTALGFA
jgi:glutamyl-Q tRNA(Asp) synthetase